MRLIFGIYLLLINFHILSQDVPTISPQFFTPEEEITITYNVTGSSLASLSEAYLWMWLPDAGIDAASNINPASSNNNATAPAKFTKLTENGSTYFSITLTLTDFLAADASKITKIGMILKGNDWSDGQTSDYITEIANGFAAKLASPLGNYGFYNEGESVAIDFSTSEAAEITFSVDNIVQTTESAVKNFQTSHLIIADGKSHLLSVSANNGAETISKNYSYSTTPIVEEAARPAGIANGIKYTSSASATLVVEAPNKENVFVIGEFNDWLLNNDYLMKKDGDYFWITINELDPAKEYQFQYLVDGTLKIADPYTTKIGSEFDDPQVISENRYPGAKPYPAGQTSEAVGYLNTGSSAFKWSDEAYTKPANEDLVIYELLIRDFTEIRTIEAVRQKLDYLESLGINAIELMPIMEFEGNLSWGYNPFSMLAFDKFYGTESDFKTFVDEAHGRGIAVILDIALNHQFGRNSLVRLYNDGLYGNPVTANPWFNTSAKHDFNVGYDMNHESEATKRYVDQVIKFWIEEYHVDGYRYDLSKGFTQRNSLGDIGKWGSYDASRIALLKRIADVQWSADPTSYVILEHFADNTEERELANYGMMLWGNLNHDFISLAKGNNRNINSLDYQSRGWEKPHLIGYMESHDEERVTFELNKSSFDLATKMQRLKLNAVFFFLVPGPKMIWQFGEFAYDEELNNDRLGVKPTHWEYLDNDEKQSLFQVYQSLIKLKTQTDHLNKDNFGWSASGNVKWIRYNNQAVEFVLIGNFAKQKEVFDQQIITSGTWFDYFTGDEIAIEATEDFSLSLSAGEFRLLVDQPIENYIDDAIENTIVLANQESMLPTFNAVYPNPAKSILHVFGANKLQNFQLHNLTGNKFSIDYDSSGKEYSILVDHIPAGMYVLSATDGNRYYQQKIIIKN